MQETMEGDLPALLAIAAYEASSEVNQFSSKFDYFLKGKTELTVEERLILHVPTCTYQGER